METKRKHESENKANKICKVITLDEKIKILYKLRGGMNTAVADLTFH
jgi:hypothetical protein